MRTDAYKEENTVRQRRGTQKGDTQGCRGRLAMAAKQEMPRIAGNNQKLEGRGMALLTP